MCFYFLSSHLFFSKELVSTFIKLSVNFCSFLKYKSDLLFQVSGVKIHRGNSVQSVDDSSVKFAMRNGKIEHVCLLDASEPKWMVNFKKGIISSLQSSVTDWSKSTNVTEVRITTGMLGPYKKGNVVPFQNYGFERQTFLKNIVSVSPHTYGLISD